jgi:hypothetical protein
MRRRLSGSFRIDRPVAGWWRVRNTRNPHEIVWLRKGGTADQGLPEEHGLPQPFDVLNLEWTTAHSITVQLGEGATARMLKVDAVQLQEPDERLYDSLPLARFTPEARRFWRRVFWLVRLPGGRALLGLVARRRRA